MSYVSGDRLRECVNAIDEIEHLYGLCITDAIATDMGVRIEGGYIPGEFNIYDCKINLSSEAL